jgi:TaqI-like C-terminal specificity domain/Eco57I restriction-modification methylase/N-6 DNA Methylase
MSDAVLKWVERCWRSLLPHASTQPRSLQALILNLLCLQLCYQNRVITRQQWRALLDSADAYSQFCQLVQTIHKRYGAVVLTPERWPMAALADGLLRQLVDELETLCGDGAIAPVLLGQAYEQCLSHSATSSTATSPRKTSGSYYTPLPIVDYIIHATLPPLVSSTLDPCLLDPSCGGGIFLLTAYQYLLTRQLQTYLMDDPERWAFSQGNGGARLAKGTDGNWHLTQTERERILLHSIYGVDIDPGAVEVTRLALRFKLLETGGDLLPSLPNTLPDLSRNIQQGNALIGSDVYDAVAKSKSSSKFGFDGIVAFDWQQAFPIILGAGGFDGVVGNPPYIDAEGMTMHLPQWRTYCTTRYRAASGNWDLFCVFIEKALQLCRPGGLVSFVVPNKLASAGYAAKVRSLLIRETQLLSIRDYSRIPIFSVAVYPLVFVAQSGTPNPHAPIAHEVMGWATAPTSDPKRMGEGRSLSVCERHTIRYSQYLANPEAPWLLSSSSQHVDLVTRLRQSFPALGTVAQVTGAATVAEAYALQPLIQNNPAPARGDLQLVNSGTIDRYCLRWGEKRLRYLGDTYEHPVIPRSRLHHLSPTRQQQATQPKIIVAGMSKVLECGFDAQGTILAGKSTSVIRIASQPFDLDLRYLLGVLNSRLVHLYFSSSFGGNRLKGGYLRIGPPQLRQIPICIPDADDGGDRHHHQQIIDRVDQILSLQRHVLTLDPTEQGETYCQIHQLEAQINCSVYALYRLTDEDIEQLG